MPCFVASRSGDTAPWYATGRLTDLSVCAEHLFLSTSIREGTCRARANAAHWSETKTKLPECFWDGAHLSAGAKPRQHDRAVLTQTPRYCSELACDKGQPVTSGPALPAAVLPDHQLPLPLASWGQVFSAPNSSEWCCLPRLHETPGSSFLSLSAPPRFFPSN